MTITRFADVVHLNASRLADPAAARIERFVGLEHITPENLHIRSWGNVADGTTFTSHFMPGQVLFGKRRAYQRKVAIAEFEGVCSGDIYVFESKDPDALLPKLLPFICQSEGFYQYAVKTSAGSLSPRTNWSHLANYEFPLPPLDEQRRIADLLWAADSVVQEWQSVAANLEVVAYSFRDTLYSNSLNYPTSKIQDISIKVSKGESPNWQGFKYLKSGVRFITSENVLFGKFEPEPQKRISEQFHAKIQRSAVEKGDLLINIVGASIGRACLVPNDIDSANVNQAVCVVRLKSEIVLPDFALACLLSKQAMRNLLSQSINTARANLTLEIIRHIEIPIPPKTVQTELMKKMNEIGGSLENCYKHIDNSKKLIRQLSKTLIN
jgi:type I restriction enzyme, S subunit